MLVPVIEVIVELKKALQLKFSVDLRWMIIEIFVASYLQINYLGCKPVF